ncbi:MAG: ester cyclase, partial [Actinomycetota bacterium]|nr:ester cyclase [Actinomycetota bacterium]
SCRLTRKVLSMGTDLKTKLERIPLEILNEGKYDLIDEIYAPDFVTHTPAPGLPPTRDGFKQFAMAYRSAFPDLHYTVEDWIEAGDKYVSRVSASGTMRGDFTGMPATNKHATWTEIHIGRVADGRLVEHWGLVDQLGMFVQLGVIPAPGQVPVAV